jgi:hypothetical protein
MSDQSRTGEALFLALANAEEASRCARALTRSRTADPHALFPVDLDELRSALQLVDSITQELAKTVYCYGAALNQARDVDSGTGRERFALSATIYAAARGLHNLAVRLRRGGPVRDSLSAVTALDTALRRRRRSGQGHDPT